MPMPMPMMMATMGMKTAMIPGSMIDYSDWAMYALDTGQAGIRLQPLAATRYTARQYQGRAGSGKHEFGRPDTHPGGFSGHGARCGPAGGAGGRHGERVMTRKFDIEAN